MDLFDTQQIQQIVPSLFISSSIAAENALELQQLGINSILICADIEPPHSLQLQSHETRRFANAKSTTALARKL